MEPDWPLTGRARELEQLLAVDGHVVLAGPEGVGRTRLAAEHLRVLERQGYVAVRVVGQRAVSDLPFGCFAGFLPEPTADRTELLRTVAATIRGRGKLVALLVDDAHLLDELSAVLLQQLATVGGIRLVVTLQSGARIPEPVRSLWKDGLAHRLDVEPLGEDDVDALLSTVLNGRIDPASRRLLMERCDGNLLYLKEIVAAGALKNQVGTWTATTPLAGSPRLTEIVETALTGLEAVDRHGVEVLAVAGALPEELFFRVCPAVDLALLQGHRLVHADRAGSGLEIRLARPLFGDVLRASMSPLRVRDLAGALADALEVHGIRDGDDRLRLASWRLEADGVVDAQLMLEAGRRAHARHDLGLAERLARAAGDGFAARLLLAQVLSVHGRVEEAEAVFAGLDPEETDDAGRASAAIARIDNLCYGLGRPQDALAVAESAERSLGSGAHRDEVQAYRASLLDVTGQTRAALTVAEELLPTAQGRAWVWASTMAAWGYVRTGQFDRAIATTDGAAGAHRELTGPSMVWNQSIQVSIRTYSLAFQGRLADAEQCALDEHRRGVDESCDETRWITAMALASVHLLQGRLRDAVRRAREATRLAREHGRLIVLRGGLICEIEALAQLGLPDEAARALAEFDEVSMPQVRVLETDADRARGWLATARGDQPAATALFTRAAERARAVGDAVGEFHALGDLARVGPLRGTRLDELAEHVEGPLVRLRAAHARARRRHAAAELETVAAELAELGATLLAAEAWADASVARHRRGDPRRALVARRAATALTARCDGARTPSVTVAGAARAALSRRELEIASLAADGHPNRDIAVALSLSPRTVENRLHTAYEKLGIRGRSELAAALGTDSAQ